MPLKERMGDEKIWRTTHTTGKDDRASELLLALLCLLIAAAPINILFKKYIFNTIYYKKFYSK